jgi:hypothetical protein
MGLESCYLATEPLHGIIGKIHIWMHRRRKSRLTTEELLEVFCLQSDLKLYKENNSLLRRGGLISKHINGLGMNKNLVMSSSEIQNKE